MLSTSERPTSIFSDYPDDWPSKEFYVNQGAVTREQYYGLKALIEKGASETEVEGFFNENRPALALVLTFFQNGTSCILDCSETDDPGPTQRHITGSHPGLPHCGCQF